MTKKKSKVADEPRFEVKKRQPKDKPNFFQNIPSFQHPLAEILNFPSENTNNQILDKTDVPVQDINNINSGHSDPTTDDTQTELYINTPSRQKPDTQNTDFLDTRKTDNHSTQNLKTLDTQKTNKYNTQILESTSTQNHLSPDTQKTKRLTLKTMNSGQPNSKLLSTETPKIRLDAPRQTKAKGATALKNEKTLHPKNENWRKYDKARSTVRVNLHVDKEIDKKVRKYCFIDADPKVELREFYERAAIHLLNFMDTQKLGSLSAETPLDDRRLKMMFKTKPFIINLYLRYNTIFNELSGIGKKWTARWSPRDDESATRYNELSADIIELGILQTQIQKGFGTSRIQTFKYYTDEIENVLGSGVSDEMLKTILDYHRQIWKKQTGREVDMSFLINE